MKKVLYISYDGLTDPLGQSQILPYLLELTKNGYHFTILSFEKKLRFEKEEQIIRSIIKDQNIEWQPLTFTTRPPVLSKMYDRYRMWQTALKLHKQNQFDLVHCRSYVAAEVGLKLKRKYGTKFIFDMRGFWADEKVDNGQWQLKKPLYKRIYEHYKEKEREFLLNADAIVVLTAAAKNYLHGQPAYKDLIIDVIPCCADLSHFDFHKVDPIKTKTLKKDLGIPEASKVISYLGSVGGWYMTREMFAFFKLLDPGWHMLILTKDDPEKVRGEAVTVGIDPERLTITYVERKSLPLYMALSQISVFFIRNSFSKIASSPTKHAELMGMGIPVVCNDIGDTGIIINKTKSGLLVNDFTQQSLQNAVRNMEELSSIDPESIRQSALTYFDLREGSHQYCKIYDRLSSQTVPILIADA